MKNSEAEAAWGLYCILCCWGGYLLRFLGGMNVVLGRRAHRGLGISRLVREAWLKVQALVPMVEVDSSLASEPQWRLTIAIPL
jgi:hypothetical protein